MRTNRIIYSTHINNNQVTFKPVEPFQNRNSEVSIGHLQYVEIDKDRNIKPISSIDLVSDKWRRLTV